MKESDWQFLEVLGTVYDKTPGHVYEQMLEAAYRGEIAWDYVRRSRDAPRGISHLFAEMARSLTTVEQLQGLLTSMDQASDHGSQKMRMATGRAGGILRDRARGRGAPLPQGWLDACLDIAPRLAGSGKFWAQTLARAGNGLSGIG
jgi:hypothetical protein